MTAAGQAVVASEGKGKGKVLFVTTCTSSAGWDEEAGNIFLYVRL